MSASISLIIPTKNRQDLILRLVRYYWDIKFTGAILIGDSSSDDIFKEASLKLSSYQRSLNITHIHLPSSSFGEAVTELNRHIDTAYACYVADDDFIVPSSIERCIDFLELNSSYVAAHGVSVLVGDINGAINKITGTGAYPQPIIEGDTACLRLTEYLENYKVPLFSVHRTETWLKMFSDKSDTLNQNDFCSDRIFADELLPSCISIVNGKIGQVKGLSLVRQEHSQRYLLPQKFTWLLNEKWRSSYMYFREELAKHISHVDKVSIETSRDMVDMAFSKYLLSRSGGPSKNRSWLRARLGKIKTLKKAWHSINWARDYYLPGNRFTLISLLSPHSKYNADFIRVFKAICNQ